MTEKSKKLTVQIIVGILLLLASWFVIRVMGEFLSVFLVQVALAAVVTWAVISIGDKIGLPGFSNKNNGKKK